jgi:hypothetical protein
VIDAKELAGVAKNLRQAQIFTRFVRSNARAALRRLQAPGNVISFAEEKAKRSTKP